ncbi:MAG: proprotein convertase P-domain-containing protein, partial [Opitutus sp.]
MAPNEQAFAERKVQSLTPLAVPARRLALAVAAAFLCGTAGMAQSLTGSNATNYNIPDNSTTWATSSISLSGAPANAQVTSVTISYDIKHTYRGDLKIWATAFYSGQWHDLVLRNREGGSTDNWIETRSNLQNWNGASPNQTWYLSAQDLASGDPGYIDSFSISVAYSSVTLPTVTTAAASGVTQTGATLGGNVTSAGGATVTQRGVVYGTSSSPTTGNATS